MGLYHFRTGSGDEVDLVLEAAGRLLPIEIKATKTPMSSAVRGLQRFLALFPREAPVGILVYRGHQVVALTRTIFAIPAGVFV